jgi:hypothetical protein
MSQGIRWDMSLLTLNAVFLHGSQFLKGEPKRIEHKYLFRSVDFVAFVHFDGDDEKDKQDEETFQLLVVFGRREMGARYFIYSKTARIAGTFSLKDSTFKGRDPITFVCLPVVIQQGCLVRVIEVDRSAFVTLRKSSCIGPVAAQLAWLTSHRIEWLLSAW